MPGWRCYGYFLIAVTDKVLDVCIMGHIDVLVSFANAAQGSKKPGN